MIPIIIRTTGLTLSEFLEGLVYVIIFFGIFGLPSLMKNLVGRNKDDNHTNV